MKWNRETILIAVMLVLLLLAVLYFGDSWFVSSVRQEAQDINSQVEATQTLMETYPPSEEGVASYLANTEDTQKYLPIGSKANDALVTLETYAQSNSVNVDSMTRNTYLEVLEVLPTGFVKNNYTIQLSSNNPNNFANLLGQLMAEERVWDVTSYGYIKVGDNQYSGTIGVDLYFYSDNVEASENEEETSEVEE